MKKIINIGLMLLVCANFANAQVEPGSMGYYEDALLFSRNTPGGTARMQAIGGAQVALGGDISAAYSNPAGLGFFNKSLFTFTPTVGFQDSETDYLNTNTTSFKNNFSFNNLGLVFRNEPKEGKFKGGTFAISLNKINDFNSEYRYEGFNGSNSIVNSFIESAGNTNPDNLSGLDFAAYEHFLIDLADYDNFLGDYEVGDDGLIIPAVGDGSYEGYGSLFGSVANSFPSQQGTVRTSGSQYQWNFSYGANYDDMIYFGAGIGVQSINYERTRSFTESAFKYNGDDDDLINSIRVNDNLKINGVGLNATFGLIVRPSDFLRLGVSYVTPTSYTLSEESNTDLNTSWNSFYSYVLPNDTIQLGNIETLGNLNLSDYSLRAPSKLTGGLAVFLGKNGFISGDVEFVNYGNAQLKSNDFSPTADNRTIANLYSNTVNYRIGGEYRFDMFRIRGGYSRQGDPFKDSNFDRSIKSISGGFGYRVSNYFVDLAVVNTVANTTYSPYLLTEGTPTADIKISTTRVSVTVGLKF